MPVVLLSEEPFWDSLWSPDPLARKVTIETRFGALPVIQLNHHTTAIFNFATIPYLLLTEPGFIAAYAGRFARNARQSAADWRQDFAARPQDAVFMAAHRPEPFHDISFPAGGLIGLCAWRTRLAEAMPGQVVRLGTGWAPGSDRLALDDWHLDKLTRLDRQARILSAIENTHQPAYVTEKLFDAFACGARPAYFAAPDHHVHRLGLPAEAWVNLHGLDPATAAERLAGLVWDNAFFEAYHAAQAALARLFGEPALVLAERRRLAVAVAGALAEVLDRQGPGEAASA
jgi:hypothetical protein